MLYEVITIRPISLSASNGSALGRGGLCMSPGSEGSKASVSERLTAVTMLIQRICSGVMGSVNPREMAATSTMAWRNNFV